MKVCLNVARRSKPVTNTLFVLSLCFYVPDKPGDQRTLHGQLRTSSVRLVDCRKSQKRKAESDPDDEAYDAESKSDDFICPSKSVCRCVVDLSTHGHSLQCDGSEASVAFLHYDRFYFKATLKKSCPV